MPGVVKSHSSLSLKMEWLREYGYVFICSVNKPRENHQALLKCAAFIHFINDDNAILEQGSARLWVKECGKSSGTLFGVAGLKSALATEAS